MMKNKQETIEKIKQAALEEFYANGYAKASLRTICRRAGVTTGAMYFSFENKEALLRAILEPLVENYEKMLAKNEPVIRHAYPQAKLIICDAVYFKAQKRNDYHHGESTGELLRRVPGACGKNDGAVISYILPEQT